MVFQPRLGAPTYWGVPDAHCAVAGRYNDIIPKGLHQVIYPSTEEARRTTRADGTPTHVDRVSPVGKGP